MNAPPASGSRLHALDSLRGAMMLLGIYLHVVVAYSPTGGWPYKPRDVTTDLDYSTAFIHIFRMPVFYVMASFFAALLLQRYGWRRAARNRFVRIVIPFVVGWIIIYPLMIFLILWMSRRLPLAVNVISSGVFLARPHPFHLWFLEYLLFLYGLASLVIVGLQWSGLQRLTARIFRSIAESPWAMLPFAALSFLFMLPMKNAGLDDPLSFMPMPHLVIAYAIPFAFGWLLFANPDLLDTLREGFFLPSLKPCLDVMV